MSEPASDEAVVYRLEPTATVEDLREGAYYAATVDGVVDYGMFVTLSEAVSGLVHESVLDDDYDVGDQLVVELTAIKDNGDLSFSPVEVEVESPVPVAGSYETTTVASIGEHVGETIHLEAVVVQIKQTAGPTLVHLADATGVVPCAAFERAGVRAYPEIEIGELVHVVGFVERGEHGLQVEVDSLTPLDGDRATEVRDRRSASLDERVTPETIEPLVEWPAIARLLPGLERIAARLRRAVHEGRPIVIRHHADTDGMCASVAVELAIERFIEATHVDPNASRHLLKRLPSRAPYYEIEDVTRDLSHALEARARHGQQLPLLVMIDNGSTAEDVPAYEHLAAYGIPVVVIDHHHPDPAAVEPYVEEHVNPYLHDEDYRVTAGMMCVELARMIDREVTASLQHLPAVAGLADHSAAMAMDDYLALAFEAGYDEQDLHAIGDGLDAAAYWLRHSAGRGITRDLLGVDGSGGLPSRHRHLVDRLSSWAQRDVERQLEAALDHVEAEHLTNGVTCYRLDVDRYAYRFTYPPPGTTTGAIHDRMVRETDEPAITIGYGPDFAVLRSDGVRLDIPEMVSELNAELAGAGVSGGGHLVVGSIRFVKGMREPVLEALTEKMSEAPVDESLGAAAPREYRSED